MRIIVAAAIVLSLASPAFAQAPSLNLAAPEKRKDPLKEMKDEEIDRAYREATQGKGVVNAPNDPWAAVRAHEQPAKPGPKTAARPKPQTQASSQPVQPQPQARPQPQPQQAQTQPQAPSPWPAAPAMARPQTQAQSQPQSNSPWPAAPTPR